MATTRKERHEKALDRLAAVLAESKKPLTAASLAKRLRCTRATVYNRLTALHDRGFQLKWADMRDGKRGPLSSAVSAA